MAHHRTVAPTRVLTTTTERGVHRDWRRSLTSHHTNELPRGTS